MKLKTYNTLHKIAASPDYMDQAMNNHRQATYMADSRRDRSEVTNRQTPATWYPQRQYLSHDPGSSTVQQQPQQPQVQYVPQYMPQQQQQSAGSGFWNKLGWAAAGALGGWFGSKYFGGSDQNNQSKATPQDIQQYNADRVMKGTPEAHKLRGVDAELLSQGGHVIKNPKTGRVEHRMSRQQLMDFYNKNKNGKPYQKYKSAEEFADAAERKYAHSYAGTQRQRAARDTK